MSPELKDLTGKLAYYDSPHGENIEVTLIRLCDVSSEILVEPRDGERFWAYRDELFIRLDLCYPKEDSQ